MLEPKRGLEPLTYRLQIGCATIAPLGPGRPSPPPGAPLTGHNKIRPPTRRGDGDCSIDTAPAKVNVERGARHPIQPQTEAGSSSLLPLPRTARWSQPV